MRKFFSVLSISVLFFALGGCAGNTGSLSKGADSKDYNRAGDTSPNAIGTWRGTLNGDVPSPYPPYHHPAR